MCCWTFLGTQSMISSQRLGQNLLDLRGKMRLTMLTVFDEPPSEATTGIIQFGANFPSGKKMNHRPATARFLPWLCVPLWLCCGLCTTVYQSVPLCTTVVVLFTTVVDVGCAQPLPSYVGIVCLPQIASHRLQISSQLRITCSRWKYYGLRVRRTIGGWQTLCNF